MGTLSRIPFRTPIEDPRLHRAEDGSVFVTTSAGASAQRFDPDHRAFAPPADDLRIAPLPARPRDLPPAFLVPGDAGMWADDRSPEGRTFFREAGAWSSGPAVTSWRLNHLAAAAHDGARLLVMTQTSEPVVATRSGWSSAWGRSGS